MTREQIGGALNGVKTNIAHAVARMPAHQDFINGYCAAEMA